MYVYICTNNIKTNVVNLLGINLFLILSLTQRRRESGCSSACNHQRDSPFSWVEHIHLLWPESVNQCRATSGHVGTAAGFLHYNRMKIKICFCSFSMSLHLASLNFISGLYQHHHTSFEVYCQLNAHCVRTEEEQRLSYEIYMMKVEDSAPEGVILPFN